MPVGHYRLEHGLSVKAAEGITIEGASGESYARIQGAIPGRGEVTVAT